MTFGAPLRTYLGEPARLVARDQARVPQARGRVPDKNPDDPSTTERDERGEAEIKFKAVAPGRTGALRGRPFYPHLTLTLTLTLTLRGALRQAFGAS